MTLPENTTGHRTVSVQRSWLRDKHFFGVFPANQRRGGATEVHRGIAVGHETIPERGPVHPRAAEENGTVSPDNPPITR